VAANNNANRFKAIIQLNCVSQHLQLQTGRFYWNKVLLPARLADSSSNNDKCKQYIFVINNALTLTFLHFCPSEINSSLQYYIHYYGRPM